MDCKSWTLGWDSVVLPECSDRFCYSTAGQGYKCDKQIHCMLSSVCMMSRICLVGALEGDFSYY